MNADPITTSEARQKALRIVQDAMNTIAYSVDNPDSMSVSFDGTAAEEEMAAWDRILHPKQS